MTGVVGVGTVIKVGDPDYMYGVGDLRMRVTKVGAVQHLRDGEWVALEGLELRRDGSQVSDRARHVVVRLTALRRQRGRDGT